MKSLETAWFQGFFFVFLSVVRGFENRILMLKLSVNFASVATCFQQFRLFHHQYSINFTIFYYLLKCFLQN